MGLAEVIFPLLPICGLSILVLAIGVVISYFLLRSTYQRILTCPKCGAKAAGEIFDTEEIFLANNIDYRGRNPVRNKETKITDHYRCETCQHTWTRTFTRRERIPIRRETTRN